MTLTDQERADAEAILEHRFSDTGMLSEALTHPSLSPDPDAPNYQRLEFLGDRVLGIAIADMLFQTFPEEEEGALSRRLNALVRKETCAEVADALGLGPLIQRGGGEAKGQPRKSILGDVCEAVLGALYLDAGFEVARGFVDRNWRPLMEQAERPRRDPKTALQEWAHAKGYGTPVYQERDRFGPDHAPVFTIAADLDGLHPGLGEGTSKRAAEQAAARAILIREGVWHGGEDG
ncbi:MAG: ribonuclease III [Pseudomonadota bacterium]